MFNSKRLLVTLMMLLGFVSPCFATIAFDQAGSIQTGGVTSVQISLTATASGALAFVCSKRGADAVSTLSITDSASQTGWTQTTTGYILSGTDKVGCFYRANSASLTTITCSWSGGTTATIACVGATFTGIATTSPSDKSIQAIGTSTQNLASGSFTTSGPNRVLIYTVGDGASQAGAGCAGWNADTGGGYTFPTGGCAARIALQYKIVSSTGSQSTTMNAQTTASTMLGDFEAFSDTPVGGGTPTCKNGILLLGAGC